MPHEIVYDAATGRVVAAQSSAAPRHDIVLSEGQSRMFLSFDFAGLPISAYRVDTGTNTLVLREDWTEPEEVFLKLEADASAAASPIDGIPEIPADGQAQIEIVIRKMSQKTGKQLTGSAHKNLLNIRTTAGVLSARQLNLSKGEANFSLRSGTQTVVAEVRVWADEIPRPATIRVEFAPV